jgi:hypothetical protein
VNRILQFYDSSMTVSLDPGHLSGAIQSIWLRGSVRATGAPTEKDPLQEGVPRSGNHVQALSPAVHAIKFCLLDDRDHRIARQPGRPWAENIGPRAARRGANCPKPKRPGAGSLGRHPVATPVLIIWSGLRSHIISHANNY